MWETASDFDILSRLQAQGGTKGAPAYSPNTAYAPNAPVRPVDQLTGTPAGPKNTAAPLPAWNGEQGYGPGLNAAQSAFIASRMPTTGQQSQPFASLNFNQTAQPNMQGAPAWADQIINQSAYNSVPKNTQGTPTYAKGWDGFNRAGNNITFRTQDVGNQWSQNAGYQIPQANRGQDWFSLVDTNRPNWWSDPSAARYEYLPQSNGLSFGQFLLGAVAPMVTAGFSGGFPTPGTGLLGGDS